MNADDTRVEHSCRLQLGPGVLGDAQGDGVIQIVGDRIEVELIGSLTGAAADAAPDAFTGVGISITGKNVVLRGARVSGYKVGIHAREADGLVLDGCDVSGNFRQHLKSTKEKENEEDWLSPHANDGHEWFTNYGAGIYVERSSGVTVRRSRARAGQNGLVLDRCDKAQVYDNDFSFLSGWGIALWRSSRGKICRNACDFCVRGYVHGVYNRGQDSAGILFFEQCSDNLVAENSATHCGDGFFAFAGQEALGSVRSHDARFDYSGRGCNGNILFGNDFSYAAAHGLELTFSFGNEIRENRLVGNAICGIWGGYSQDTRILRNQIEDNGDAGNGLERGGIDIEHGRNNDILGNSFRRNACGVHLWWDADEPLARLRWATANVNRSESNTIALNDFQGDRLAIQLRECDETWVMSNTMKDVARELDVSGLPPQSHEIDWTLNPFKMRILGETRPVGARAHLRSRDKIQLDEWGPIEPPLETK